MARVTLARLPQLALPTASQCAATRFASLASNSFAPAIASVAVMARVVRASPAIPVQKTVVSVQLLLRLQRPRRLVATACAGAASPAATAPATAARAPRAVMVLAMGRKQRQHVPVTVVAVVVMVLAMVASLL